MKTIYLDSLKVAKLSFIAAAIMLPGFVHYSRKPNLTRVDHVERLQYAKQVFSEKEYVDFVFERSDSGEVENYIIARFEKAFPNESSSLIYAWANTLINESNRAKMDPLFVMAIIEQESRFNSKVVGGHGEIGLMQLRPRTAAWIAKKAGIRFNGRDQLFNPDVNIKLGILYLAYLNRKFDNVRHSTSAYNMGPRNVKRVIASQRQPAIYHDKVYQHYRRFYADLKLEKTGLVVAYQ